MVYQLLVGVCLAFTTLGNSLNKASRDCVLVYNNWIRNMTGAPSLLRLTMSAIAAISSTKTNQGPKPTPCLKHWDAAFSYGYKYTCPSRDQRPSLEYEYMTLKFMAGLSDTLKMFPYGYFESSIALKSCSRHKVLTQPVSLQTT